MKMRKITERVIAVLQNTSKEISFNNQTTIKTVNEQAQEFKMGAITSLAEILVTILLRRR